MKFSLKFLSITYQNKQKHKILAMPWLPLFIRNHHPTPPAPAPPETLICDDQDPPWFNK